MEFFTFEAACVIWFFILGILLIGYAILDGFDLGVAMLGPLVAKTDTERRVVINSIGPLWDGNEVWLVTFGGALFAMFPEAYASIFSGFYLAFMLLLFALIFRAVSIEFRSKSESMLWRTIWDYGFCFGSLLATFIFGIGVGNILRGIPLDEQGNFTVGLLWQLHAYPVLVGFLAVATFALHGGLFLILRSNESLRARVKRLIWPCYGYFLITYMLATMFSIAFHSHLLDNLKDFPVLWLVPVAHVICVALIPRFLLKRQYLRGFFASCGNIAALVGILGISIFPELIPGSASSAGLSIYDSASSNSTLHIGLLIVLIGMPFVLGYTAIIYWTFRGKVDLNIHSY